MNNLLYHVDAFTSEPYKGNPAAVMISSGALTEEYMQTLAAELNLSETAFLTPQDGGFRIRFYTPECEIDLCGHATLSAAHIIYEAGLAEPATELHFFSKAGELTVQNSNGLIIMDFPVYKLEKVKTDKVLNEASGLAPLELYKCDYNWYLALLKTEKEVINAAPDFNKLKETKYANLIVTAQSEHKEIDFLVRCFVPGMGINEDPVTGSAHCALTPFWAKKMDKNEFTSFQASKRGGYLRLKLAGERVYIAGNAVTILKSEILSF